MGPALAGALAHAHGLGIVHRDVKPGNVLVDRDRQVRLTDFGIARLRRRRGRHVPSPRPAWSSGPPPTSRPNRYVERPRPEADIYTLGLVLLEAVTGERAYDGPPAEAAMARLQRPPRVPVLTPWLASLLDCR